MVALKAEDLRLPARAWKVKLIGEGADDAGGVFDDTITEMCQVGKNVISHCCLHLACLLQLKELVDHNYLWEFTDISAYFCHGLWLRTINIVVKKSPELTES